MKPGKETLETLLDAPAEEVERLVGEMSAAGIQCFLDDWPAWVREGQEPPAAEGAGADWRVWVMLCGRGFGKTLAGAQWVSEMARDNPGASIALVAANVDEARRLMVEGRSGLLAVARAGEEADGLLWEPSRRRLVFASGAEAFLYSGAHADSLRGPEHHFAWCDELAKWEQAPVATLFESGRAKFAGRFPALEEELRGLTWGGAYLGPGRSPDRADAMVWAMTELLLAKERPQPRVRFL
jgi:phage terminase large subunit-like protein